MKNTRGKLSFYRRVRAALMATNVKTDNSIITACNIVRPLADNKEVVVPSRGVSRKRVYVKPMKSYGRRIIVPVKKK